MAQSLIDNGADRCLAVGPGDTDHLHDPCGVVVDCRSESGKGQLGLWYTDNGNSRRRLYLLLHHHCGCLLQLGDKVVTIEMSPTDGDKDRALTNLTRIPGNGKDFAIGIAMQLHHGELSQQGAQEHFLAGEGKVEEGKGMGEEKGEGGRILAHHRRYRLDRGAQLGGEAWFAIEKTTSCKAKYTHEFTNAERGGQLGGWALGGPNGRTRMTSIWRCISP